MGEARAARAESDMPANRCPKWQRDHQALQAALSRGRRGSSTKGGGSGGGSRTPLSSVDQIESQDDRVLCDHCGRRFGALAAERHIPKCRSILAKPKMLVRGGGHLLLAKPPSGRAVTSNGRGWL